VTARDDRVMGDDRAEPLRAVVVIPARDEAARIGRCLDALGAQEGVDPREFAIVVVLDSCRDATAAAARVAAERIAPAVEIAEAPAPGVGHARRHGMELAATRLAPTGLIATTDADTVVAPDWLATQLALADDGAEAIGGAIDLDPIEAATLDPRTPARRAERAHERMRAVLAGDPEAEHHFFSGASIGVTAGAYRRAGGLEPRAALEDEAFERRLHAAGTRIVRSARVRVRTSARTESRAGRGLARDLELGEWLARRRYDGRSHTTDELLERKGGTTISVIVPAKECAGTIEGVLATTVLPLAERGLVDEVLVVDAGSADGTAARAAALGADVRDEDDLLAEHGPALGKGDAMWRGLAATSGDVVAFVDADTEDPHPAHLLGLLGPLLADPALQLVKAAFARPFRVGDEIRPDDGGRVTELMARPLLNLHVPALAGFAQPLAGETAARRSLLEALPFPAGYGVEVALLIDALRHAGLDALAESSLGTRQNRHQPLRELGPMAFAVLCAVERRVRTGDAAVPQGLIAPWDGAAVRDVPVLERPPLATLAARRPNALAQSA
jgi:glucosyl-3-phosphoglycerate synthase